MLVAAGRGTRLGAGMPKALVPLGHGRHEAPVVVHALRAALRCRALTSVVVVAPPDPEGMAQLADAVSAVLAPPGVEVAVVAGGAERSDSVALGLRALPPGVDVVLVHDAARALTPVEVFDRVVAAVRSGHAAVTPAVPVSDTIKQVAPATPSDRTPGVAAPAAPSDRTPGVAAPGDLGAVQTVVATIERSSLRAVQTPQGFRRETLEEAHARIQHAVTDDCGMVEALGGTVTVVEGSPRAMKITTPDDLTIAAAWLEEETADRSAPTGRGPALVVLSGLPGVGKTTLACALARDLGATHLRVDSIEQALVRSGVEDGDRGAHGYRVAYAVAADQLVLGGTVVADLVNGIGVVREAWDEVGRAADALVVRVLVQCGDLDEHRRRVTSRTPDIEGHALPDWEASRSRDVEPWPAADLTVDTGACTADEAAARIVAHLRDRMCR